jgi:hypothetical protein
MLTPTRMKQTAVRSTSDATAELPSMSKPVVIPDGEPLPWARRLVVLVPVMEVDEARLARRVWMLASANRLDVLYVALVREPDDESRARRRLATLAALTRDEQISVETRVQPARSWLKLVRPIVQRGDLLMCHADQTVDTFGFRRRPLAPELAAAIHAPVVVLSGMSLEPPLRGGNRISRFIYGSVPYAIVAGFFEFQVQAARLTRGWMSTALICLSVLVEFGLIWIWTSVTG